MDRFGQIEPKILFAADGYHYNGKRCDSLARVAEIAARIDSIESVVIVPLAYFASVHLSGNVAWRWVAHALLYVLIVRHKIFTRNADWVARSKMLP